MKVMVLRMMTVKREKNTVVPKKIRTMKKKKKKMMISRLKWTSKKNIQLRRKISRLGQKNKLGNLKVVPLFQFRPNLKWSTRVLCVKKIWMMVLRKILSLSMRT